MESCLKCFPIDHDHGNLDVTKDRGRSEKVSLCPVVKLDLVQALPSISVLDFE